MKKQCRRKHYVLLNPIKHAIDGAAVIPDNELLPLRVLELQAIDAFAKDKGTPTEWHQIVSILNLAETLARDGVGIEVLDVCERVQNVLKEAQRRFVDTGVMRLTPKDIFWLRELYEFHDLQRKSIARSVYEAAIQKTTNMVKSKSKKVEVL